MELMVKGIPADCEVTVPLFPDPAVNVSPGNVMRRFATLPATSVKVPKFDEPDTPAIVAVPVFVMLPDASGVPAVGRTRIFCQVSEFRTPLAEELVIVRVI